MANALTFSRVGQKNTEAAYDPTAKMLIIRIPMNPNAIQASGPSKSGKTRVLATTGGFVGVDGTDAKISLNVTLPLTVQPG